jgi:hypothetical protein
VSAGARGTRTGAALLVEALVSHGVRHLFTVSGNHILSIVMIEGLPAPTF